MTETTTPLLTLAQSHGIKQIALIVRDLDRSVRAYWDLLRIGPWTGYTMTPEILKDMRYRGQPASFSFRHAFAWKDGVQMELIQPLEGQSLFADHLAEHGEGLHHVGIFVPDHAKAVAELESQGFKPLQSARGFGAEGDGAFAYFEIDQGIATIVELIQPPKVRRPPAFVYPPESN